MSELILCPASRLSDYVFSNPPEELGRMRKVLQMIRRSLPVGTWKSADGGSTEIYAKHSMRTEGYIQVICLVVVKSDQGAGRVVEQEKVGMLLMNGMRR